MLYVTYDPATGILTGCFLQELQPAHAAHHIEVTAEEAAVFTSLRANAARDGLEPLPPAPMPPLDRPALGGKIDNAADAVAAPYTRFTVEYTTREQQAQAFKDGGYAGEAGPYVMQFATPAGKTAAEATDIILAQAAQLRSALDQLSALRMNKYLVYRAATDADAQAAFDQVMAGIAAVGAALAGG